VALAALRALPAAVSAMPRIDLAIMRLLDFAALEPKVLVAESDAAGAEATVASLLGAGGGWLCVVSLCVY
jgi:hypothetical protein